VVRSILVTGLLVAAVLVVVMMGRPASAGTSARPVSVRYHVVMPGETLLQIANDAVPGADPRDVAAEIMELNALPGSGVHAGDRLALPAGE
jgi:hypothetical protein